MFVAFLRVVLHIYGRADHYAGIKPATPGLDADSQVEVAGRVSKSIRL